MISPVPLGEDVRASNVVPMRRRNGVRKAPGSRYSRNHESAATPSITNAVKPKYALAGANVLASSRLLPCEK